MKGLKCCLCVLMALLPKLAPLHSESRDKIAAAICDFLIGNYSVGQIAGAVKMPTGNVRGRMFSRGISANFYRKELTLLTKASVRLTGNPNTDPTEKCTKFVLNLHITAGILHICFRPCRLFRELRQL